MNEQSANSETTRIDKAEALIVCALYRHRDLSGHQLAELSGLWSGTLYPALISLERRGEISGYWEDMTPPRRRRYRLTEKGRAGQAA